MARRSAALLMVSTLMLLSCSLRGAVRPTATATSVATATVPDRPAPPTSVPSSASPATPAAQTATPLAFSVTPARSSPVASPFRAATPATPGTPATPVRAPTATPTSAPSAISTAAVTATPRPDYTARDSTSLCQITLPGAFVDDGGIWRVGNEAGVTLTSMPTGGFLDFDSATTLLLASFRALVPDYQETGRTREDPDRLRITYTGAIFGARGSGILYQRQFGQTICGLALYTAEGYEGRYAAMFERIITSLVAVR